MLEEGSGFCCGYGFLLQACGALLTGPLSPLPVGGAFFLAGKVDLSQIKALAPEVDPFPYVVAEGLLDEEALRGMRRNWPGEGYFRGEIPGNYICGMVPFIEDVKGQSPWRGWTAGSVPSLVIGLLSRFAEWLEVRFPGERGYYLSNYSLMQSKGDYGGHDVHTHHYHDPQWVMTILMYLDPQAVGHSGTTLMRVRAGMDEAAVAAQTLDWQDRTEDVVTVPYAFGRCLAFLENPVSFHRVKPSVGALFGRRILRFHVATGIQHIERLYGTDLAGYQKARNYPTNDERVLGWMRRDVEQVRSVKPWMSAEQRWEWARKIELGIQMRDWSGVAPPIAGTEVAA